MDPATMALMKTLIGGSIGGALGGLFGGSPTAAAQKYLKGIPGQVLPYLSPYIQTGKTSLPILEQQYGMMVGDPGALLAKLSSGYKQSPGYQNRLQQSLQAATNAAAAGGMLGSPQSMQQAAGVAEQAASEDWENYLNRVMGLYQGGIGGYGDLTHLGYGAATNYADLLSQLSQAQAQLAAGGAQQQSGLFGKLGSAIGSLFMM